MGDAEAQSAREAARAPNWEPGAAGEIAELAAEREDAAGAEVAA
jgi:hypothetical protein